MIAINIMDERITVKLFAGLGENFPIPDSTDLSVPRTVQELIKEIGIPEEKAAIIFIDNRHAKLADTVRPGEVLALFPPIGGG